MKVFDYKCNQCSTITEHLVKSNDSKPICPNCGSNDCGKLVSAPSGIKTNFYDKPKTFSNRNFKRS